MKVPQSSQVYGRLKPVYTFEYLTLPDGKVIRANTCREFAQRMMETSEVEGRRMTCIMSYHSLVRMSVPNAYKSMITLESVNGKPTITHVSEGFYGFSKVRVGMVIITLEYGNGDKLRYCIDVEKLQAIIDSDDSTKGVKVVTRDPTLELPATMVEEDFDSGRTRMVNQITHNDNCRLPSLMEFGM